VSSSPIRVTRRWLPWLVIGGLLVVLGIVSAPAGQGGALDPNGTGPNGAKALVLLLRSYGAVVTVDRGVPGPDDGAALVLQDQLTDARRSALAAWVAAGGRLVVADPRSPLQLGAATDVSSLFTSQDLTPQGPCPALGLSDVDQLSVGPSLLLRLPPGSTATGCYPYSLSDGEQAWFVLSAPQGRGSVVTLGGAGVWTNARLGTDDNAALAVDLLAPRPAAHVDILAASLIGGGNRSTLDLLNPRLKSSLIEVLVALAVLAWWKSRRLGRPVPESGVVTIAGSELVVAVGDLLARTGSRDAAARQLREGTRAWLGERLGLGRRATADHLADVLTLRAGTPRDQLVALLADAPVADEEALVVLAQSLAHLRQEVQRGRSPSGS
jgi:hypothetical protein